MNDAGVVREALGRLVRGERSPAELLGIGPEVVNGLFAMGVSERDRGRHVVADNLFRRCVMLDPFRAELWIALAASAQSLGRPADAGEIYQIAGLMTPDPAPVAFAAACFAEAGQIERARILAQHVRDKARDVDHLLPWLSMADHGGARPEVQP